MRAKVVSLLTVLALMAVLPACATPLTYSAKEVRGQIVDAETGDPIKGAIVVAQWVLFHVGIGHGGHKSRIHIDEAVTDKDGRYYVPAWGPKIRPPMTELVNRDPEILIFKSDYEPRTVQNSDMNRTESVRVSEWDGKIIKLNKSNDNIERQGRYLGSFFTSLGYGKSDTDWRNYPRMLIAVYAEKRRLRSLGLKPGRAASIPDIEHFQKSDRDYLRRFEKNGS